MWAPTALQCGTQLSALIWYLLTGEMIIRNYFYVISNPCELVEYTFEVVLWFGLIVNKKVLVFSYSWKLLTGLLHFGVIKSDALTSGTRMLICEPKTLEVHLSLLVSSCLFRVRLLGHHFGRGRRYKLMALMQVWANSRTAWSCVFSERWMSLGLLKVAFLWSFFSC